MRTDLKNWLASVLSVLILSAAGAAATAQSPPEARSCQVLLEEAQAHYDIGRFTEAIRSAEECLAKARGRAESTLAHSLLAKAHLASDELAKADAAISDLLAIHPDYEPAALDPPRFIARVDALRVESTEVRISSVSKSSESLEEAPATVAVLTAEEIARRGYSDLEALIHDLSGFDVSRVSGSNYSNLYQRGYRSDITTRTQLLIDGVVENDLFSQVAYLSRQYPLSNVDRVEVIYGPASTMYGANAFAGVINVVTKDPGKLIDGDQRFGLDARLTVGSWNTRDADVTLAGRTRSDNVSWSLTARAFESDEMDLSGDPDWDFDLTFFDRFDYAAKLNKTGASAQQFLDDHPEFPRQSDLYTITFEGDQATAIQLTATGIETAARLDKSAFMQTVDGFDAGYEDTTETFLLHGKLKAPNLILGFQVWDKTEGWGSVRTDQLGFGKRTWSPQQAWFYLTYEKSIGDYASLTLFSRGKEHKLDGNATNSITVFDYQNGVLGRRGLFELAFEEEPAIEILYWYVQNTQFVNELKFVYTPPGEKLSIVSGLEYRNASVQGAYVRSDEPNPAETGPIDNVVGANRFTVRDVGLYGQATYKPRPDLKLVAGGRFDDNEVQDTGGFGTVFNPRLAVIYLPGDFVFKAMYSEAFQDASFLQKLNVTATPNPTLSPEEVANFEVSAGWHPGEHFQIDAVWYDAAYDGTVALVENADCTNVPAIFDCDPNNRQFQNVGSLEISGLQVDAKLRYEKLAVFDDFTVYGNYTYTDPFDVEKQARIADIASHQLNLGVSASFRDQLDFDLRANYVDSKPVGPETNLPSNDLEGGEIDSYFVAHGSLRWKLRPHYRLQLNVNNLFDEEYFHPGIRGADGTVRPHRIPQQERAFFLRLAVTF